MLSKREEIEMWNQTNAVDAGQVLCPAPIGAMEYASDALDRITDATDNAIENEIIRARELGQQEGRTEEAQRYKQQEKQQEYIIARLQEQIRTLHLLQNPIYILPATVENRRLCTALDAKRNVINAANQRAVEREHKIAELQKRNDWQARQLTLTTDSLIDAQQRVKQLEAELEYRNNRSVKLRYTIGDEVVYVDDNRIEVTHHEDGSKTVTILP